MPKWLHDATCAMWHSFPTTTYSFDVMAWLLDQGISLLFDDWVVEALLYSIEQQVHSRLAKDDTLDEQYFYASTLDKIKQQHRVPTALIWPFHETMSNLRVCALLISLEGACMALFDAFGLRDKSFPLQSTRQFSSLYRRRPSLPRSVSI